MKKQDKVDYLIDLSESENTAFGRVDFEDQNSLQRVFSTLWWFDGEVHNGGFEQFLSNPSGQSAPYVETSLNTIGATRVVPIWLKAVKTVFPNEIPLEPSEISLISNSLSEKQLTILDKLDKKYFAMSNEVADLLYDFVQLHSSEFGIGTVRNKPPSLWLRIKNALHI